MVNEDVLEVEQILSEYEEFSNKISEEIEILKNSISNENMDILETVLLEELGISLVNDSIEDVDGGNVQTAHNYKNKVLAPNVVKEDYDRAKWDSPRAKEEYREERKKEGTYYSDFSGKTQNEQKNSEKSLPVEHCKGIYPIVDGYAFLDKGKIKEIINSKDNLALLTDSENSSKGAKELDEWKKENSERFKEDKEKSKVLNEKVKKTNNKLKKESAKYYTKNSLKQGAKLGLEMAVKTAITQAMVISNKEFIIYVKTNNKPNMNLKDLLKVIIEGVRKGVKKIFKEIKTILLKSLDAAKNGILSTIITTIINIFATTAKSLVKSIRRIIRMITDMKEKFKNINSSDPKKRKKEIYSLILAGIMSIPIFSGLGITQGIENVLLKLGIPNGISDVLALGISTLIGSAFIILIGGLINLLNQSNTKKLEIINSQLKTDIEVAKALNVQIELQKLMEENEKIIEIENKKREKLFERLEKEFENSNSIKNMISSIKLDFSDIKLSKNVEEEWDERNSIKLERIKEMKLRLQ